MKTKNIKFKIISYEQGATPLLGVPPYLYAPSIEKAKESAKYWGVRYFEDTQTNKIYSTL